MTAADHSASRDEGMASRTPCNFSMTADGAWRLNPYPSGLAFAFTIVHDADSAYSARLAPLFEEFDRLNLKITATVFAFWADWGRNGACWEKWRQITDPRSRLLAPVAVPLVDDDERAFYLSLAARGHEIGLHTASETSDTTEETQRAFKYFTEVFGQAPTVYVEHSAESNREAQENEGANPESKYYSLGVLKSYNPWVWVDSSFSLPARSESRFYDLSAVKGGPFPELAFKRYGLTKAFMRTGKPQQADGDGFLEWYSTANIDELERNRGMALVYTHLDSKWLDEDTLRMRADICTRLRYLASKKGWFVPAGTILDRLCGMKSVALKVSRGKLEVQNRGQAAIDGVTVMSSTGLSLCGGKGVLRPGPRGDIVIGNVLPGKSLSFQICS